MPDRPYFPFVLANGIDSVMIDYSGSMHCDSGHLHIEQHGGAVCGWEKIPHRAHAARLPPLVQCPYQVLGGDGELFEVGHFHQHFDPVRAVMITDVEACILRLRITVFLTQGHVYAERFEVRHADAVHAPALAFHARRPRYHMLTHQLCFPSDYRLNLDPVDGSAMTGRYSFAGVEGHLAMALRSGRAVEPVHRSSTEAGFLIRGLRTGDVIERYITVQDTSHTQTPGADCAKAMGEACRAGFAAVRRSHESGWRTFHHHTAVALPDPEMQDVYRKSLWMIRASQHPNGFITEGLYDGFKGGGHSCYWDLTFPLRALVTSNQRDAARKLLDFYENTLPVAREYAGHLGRPGAYFPWFADCTGRSLNFKRASDMPGIQKWNNGCQGMQLCDPYRFWGDREEMRRRLPLVREIADFLLAEIVESKGNRFVIKGIQGADENIDRVNDTSHLLTTIETLAGYVDGCRALGQEPGATYEHALAGLRKSLAGNYRDGVLLPWRGAKRGPESATFTYQALSLPAGVGASSLRLALRQSQGAWGLTHPGTYRNLIWPWTEGRAAVAFSTRDSRVTYQRLKHVLQFASTHGIFPEKVRPDGFWVLFGYLTAHATFVWAVNSLLAVDDGHTLSVARGVPADWGNLSFADIYTPSGYGVSLTLENGTVRHFEIENTRPEVRRVRVRRLNDAFPNAHLNRMITLAPGRNRIA
ncbi:MAG: hypothetical protein A3K19_25440 [Lentisphaerae bacterium RIFOXYB12_FULL_65_16]|nr:MAG: hypothetical protein A3K18_15315 [Lentisphaerae bacterium RIFOXYA12_64_32]OGV84877.1 MAG: hypothetical protein A3K19_25440 [Lentisphaerae bacterium RIFOXYB12_FULL_65_16]